MNIFGGKKYSPVLSRLVCASIQHAHLHFCQPLEGVVAVCCPWLLFAFSCFFTYRVSPSVSYVKVCVLAQRCALRLWRSKAGSFPKAAKVGVQSCCWAVCILFDTHPPVLQLTLAGWVCWQGRVGGTRLESLEDVVGNVSTTFIFKMLIKLIWIIDKYFLACQILTLQVCPLNSSPPSPVLPRECIPKTFSSAFMNGFEYLWHQFHVFLSLK